MIKRSKRALLVLALLVGIALALQTPLLRHARSFVWRTWVNSVARLTNLGPLELENSLQDELIRLQAENIRLRAEKHDYERVRQQLGAPALSTFRAIPALTATRPVDIFRTHFVLNRGAADGITLGAPVISEGSILLGFVVELQDHTAVAELLLHPATSVPAEVATEPNARGLVLGRTYTSLALTVIPRDAAIAPGHPVTTIAQEHIPPGLLIGTIAEVRSEENEAYQEAYLKLPYDPENLGAVSVIVPP
jgi:cell shape-determining protein MreC